MKESDHLPILDGWRAISISCVLAGHLLPLGPKFLKLNSAVAGFGMAIFFTLSGFLITRLLLARPNAIPFLIRRLFRILPLGWAAMIILILANHASGSASAANLMFYANLPPDRLLHGGEVLWSLCVEVQFYVGIALLVACAEKRGLLILPVCGLMVTAMRFYAGEPYSIVTWYRLDEILAGATLGLIYYHHRSIKIPRVSVFVLAPLALLACHEDSGAFLYFRPYAVSAMIGSSIYFAPRILIRIAGFRSIVWIASTSYGLYVIHGLLGASWLASGNTLVKYSKRPLLFGCTVLIAHLSHRYYELPMQERGRRLAKRWETRRSQPRQI